MSSLVLKDARYLGGLRSDQRQRAVTLTVDRNGVRAKGGLADYLLDAPWSSIAVLEVDGPDTIEKRITATRLALVGIFAFAVKKKAKKSYVFVSVNGMGDAIFEVDGVTRFELLAKLSPFRPSSR